MQSLLDLVLPRECGGCEAAGTLWCGRCEDALRRPPVAIRPRCDPGVPCWALGTYSGPRRTAVLALKERNRHDVAAPLGRALAYAIEQLRMLGEIDPVELASLALIPAPSRRRAARARGGDPVERFSRAAASTFGTEHVTVSPLLRMGRGVRDSVGLGAAQRQENVAGKILVSMPKNTVPYSATDASDTTVLLVDDVLTTGATVSESICVLKHFGIRVDGVLVVAAV
ncbi:ComF family protein [Rhodococcoides yunnanense]|uniref:ComF family protein n=1 Tax=Rhodococcoides yunnanense TaxID=278209 RepID=UPI000934EB83|nr:uracil phosphoribosyltransferase [Rhodococcus yunnanensis]